MRAVLGGGRFGGVGTIAGDIFGAVFAQTGRFSVDVYYLELVVAKVGRALRGYGM